MENETKNQAQAKDSTLPTTMKEGGETVREFFARKQEGGETHVRFRGLEIVREGERFIVPHLGESDRSNETLEEVTQKVGQRRGQEVVAGRLKKLFRERGDRYRGCTLENFIISTEDQQRVVQRLKGFQDAMPRREKIPDEEYDLNTGTWYTPSDGMEQRIGNVLLVGPAGTGKDHLLAALMSAAIDRGFTILWTSGAKLWSEFRDQIDSGISEESLLANYLDCDILVVSDPKPIIGALTGYQAAVLYGIVDERYSRRRPIWSSINAASRADAEAAIGTPIVDRLIDGAELLTCNWPIYRDKKA